jgi:hypothetical protein
MILAIDPGTDKSGVVLYDSMEREVTWAREQENVALIEWLRHCGNDRNVTLVIEMVESFGLAVGKSTFETVRWIGRFQEAWENRGGRVEFVGRRDVKMCLCGRVTYPSPETGALKKVGDAEIRRAILDRFPATGGGKTPEIGPKRQPGPLHGVHGHLFAALGVALTFAERVTEER